MTFSKQSMSALGVAVLLTVTSHAADAEAGLFRRPAAATSQLNSIRLDQIQRALDERRLMDAGQMIDELTLSGASDPRLHLLIGELGLTRGRYEAAIQAFRLAASAPAYSQAAMEGEGLALAHMKRPESRVLLTQVVKRNPAAWRAWNALGVDYDRAQNWVQAEQAYEHAIRSAPNPALALNNRGYSRLLQGRLDAAAADFVAALEKQPDQAVARANLRLTLALQGDYARAVDGASARDRAALLNNAGLAAGARGDFRTAETLLQQAMTSKGEFYQRASDNLTLVRDLATRTQGAGDVGR